ncbi:MAG: helix-turn-helix domain-containing protein [Boseongicola sp.]|nr:helix-turn-helix domain-containing protein [Boseongicola sp.]
MPSLPITLFAALVLAFLFLRMAVTGRAHTPLAWVLGLCAMQATVISLAQHYGVPGARMVQPVTATLVPSAAWLAFQAARERYPSRRDFIHSLGSLVAVSALLVLPAALDVVIPLLFAGYGAAILWNARGQQDAFLNTTLEAGGTAVRLWQIIGIALVASAFSDVLIVAALVAGAGHLKPWIISLYSVGNLLLIGGLSLSRGLATLDPAPATPESDPVQEAGDAEIMARLEMLMDKDRLYLDPDLTLGRLARRLCLPAKQLSAAINRSTGENVSRYVNRARVAEAQRALKAGQSVTQSMFSAGFQTKSNSTGSSCG